MPARHLLIALSILLAAQAGLAAPAPRRPPEAAALAFFRFAGDATNAGSGEATFDLRNTEFRAGGLYLSGAYGGGNADRPGGYRAVCRTPGLDYQAFTVAVRLKAEEFGGSKRTLISGGPSFRWFGLERSDAGELVVTFNNGDLKHPLPGTAVPAGEWVVVACSVDVAGRKVRAYLGGRPAGEFDLPAGFAFRVVASREQESDKAWAFTNYGSGGVFHGLVGGLAVYGRALTPAEVAAIPLRP